MTKQEALTVLAILKTAYPSFYKDYSKEELNAAVELWASMFVNESGKVVLEAVKSLICTLRFPPTIADVKEKIELLTQPEQMTEMEAWNLVKKAMNTSDFVKSFQELPPIIRRIVGSASQLKEWAYTEGDINVISSNFMRSYRARAAHEHELARLPQSAKEMIAEIAEGMKMIE
jgi:hypothetical protein